MPSIVSSATPQPVSWQSKSVVFCVTWPKSTWPPAGSSGFQESSTCVNAVLPRSMSPRRSAAKLPAKPFRPMSRCRRLALPRTASQSFRKPSSPPSASALWRRTKLSSTTFCRIACAKCMAPVEVMLFPVRSTRTKCGLKARNRDTSSAPSSPMPACLSTKVGDVSWALRNTLNMPGPGCLELTPMLGGASAARSSRGGEPETPPR
mmetsp:Transcript_2933/g.8359  ORF Transcript_2933/g.8359 Transcript_2933/m.8359 type:complete len:206 (-) Transcript_2933:8-625(-)